MGKKKMCKFCKVRPAEVPDRDVTIMWRPSICVQCHAVRLRGDLTRIAVKSQPEREATEEEAPCTQS